MILARRDDPTDEDMSLAFQCPGCSHEIVMQTNSGESQLVHSLGVQIGSSPQVVPPMAGLRAHLSDVQLPDERSNSEPIWSASAEERMARHPRYLRPLIRKANTDYAQRQGLNEITPEVMDACRQAQAAP
jgi:hypothetical protein